MFRRFIPAGIAAAFCASVAHGAWFQPLGTLPGGDRQFSDATDLSADGTTAVGVTTNDGGNYYAVRWTPGSSMQIVAGGDINSGNGVSGDGTVIVGLRSTDVYGEGAKWTLQSGVVGLGDLPGGVFSSVANDISADGSVIVGTSTSALGSEAFRWSPTTGMVGLGLMPGADYGSFATAVSADGSVIVGDGFTEPPFSVKSMAFRWTAATGMVPLGDLPGGDVRSAAFDVSEDGSVVVGYSVVASGPVGWRGFRWTKENGMVELPGVPGVGLTFRAEGISGDGNVIVGIAYGGHGNAFAWDSEHGSRSIASLLESQGVELEGWNLVVARAASYDGLTIVGQGINPSGVTEAWMAQLDAGTFVPEPKSLIVAIGGFIAVLLLLGLRRSIRNGQ